MFCFIFWNIFINENSVLKEKLAFYENNLKEAVIIAVSDACVYVYDDYKEAVIEVDIFDEIIHTEIEVGDIAIYVVDYDYTDADLIAIEKNN